MSYFVHSETVQCWELALRSLCKPGVLEGQQLQKVREKWINKTCSAGTLIYICQALAETNKQTKPWQNHTTNPRNFTSLKFKFTLFSYFRNPQTKRNYGKTVIRVGGHWFSITVVCPSSEPKIVLEWFSHKSAHKEITQKSKGERNQSPTKELSILYYCNTWGRKTKPKTSSMSNA